MAVWIEDARINPRSCSTHHLRHACFGHIGKHPEGSQVPKHHECLALGAHEFPQRDLPINNLTGESRDKTYDAFSLLFLMSKSGEINPLMRAIEAHPSTEVRLAVVKLLALSGQPDVLPAFRRMAVRGTLPPEVRSAVMEAIYQVGSQTPGEEQPAG